MSDTLASPVPPRPPDPGAARGTGPDETLVRFPDGPPAEPPGTLIQDADGPPVLPPTPYTPPAVAVPAVDGGSAVTDADAAQVAALYGSPKVTDFGLARRLEEESQHTCSGEILGTPSYMAPEQAEGRGFRAGPAADIWALGAILY